MREVEQLYPAAQAARVLGVSRSRFFALLAARQLPAADVLLPGSHPAKGKRWSAGALMRWIDSRRVDRTTARASF